jgi:hypothetical protein
MPLEKRLTMVAWAIVATVAVACMIFIPGTLGSRLAMVTIIAGGAVQVAVYLHAGRRFAETLRAAAGTLGLTYVASKKEEERAGAVRQLRYAKDRDVYKWKVDGRYPYVAGEHEGQFVMARVPLAVDFDTAAPDSTRISAYQDSKLQGFTIWNRAVLKADPKGRRVSTTDPAFDEKFLVIGRVPEEVHAVLTPPIRGKFLSLGATGFRGVEVTRYGAFLHEEGRVSDAATVVARLGLVAAVAGAIAAVAGQSSRETSPSAPEAKG